MVEEKTKDNVQTSKENIKQDIASLKTKVAELNSKKEEWFNKKEELNKKISELVKILKAVNPEIETEKKRENELKIKRDDLNKIFREQLTLSKDLVKERDSLTNKFGRSSNPAALKSRLDKLEYTVETEAISMDKEKKLMREIKELRKAVMEAGEVSDFKSQMSEISKTLTEAKDGADKHHAELKDLLNENKKKFKDYLINSKKVNSLKKEQRQAFKKFIEFKTEFSKLSSQLNQALKESGEQQPPKKKKIKPRRDNSYDKEHVRESFIDTAKLIEERVKEVEEKIKNKKKLTTKDLITLQGSK